ncbi:response regulator transcription factor [Chryseobacterium sp. SN22]|uniref:response regulator transcription factor n=1 Tax=Chryseobacterium sp. SN22 TaxID=2606431 RepID=UPI0011EDC4BB|nr:response regulator transcription factor [Chryseobacterium sp. SN22]KAA0130647.1 response regulator transcription factor [Chryseobacterium sp. SN22]
MKKKILIADDHSVVRVGTQAILKQHIPDLYIDFAKNYYELKEKLHQDIFDLLILDIEMEGSTYKDMIKEIKQIRKDIKIMVFTSYNEHIGLEYIQEGANGYLNKLSNDEMLIAAVESIYKQGYYYPDNLVKISFGPPKKDPEKILSERELQVFNMLVESTGNLEIANALDVKAGTVATYKKRIYNKLGVNNLIDLFKVYKKIN